MKTVDFPEIKFENSSQNYPYIAEFQSGAGEFLGIGVYHFISHKDYQFKALQGLLGYARDYRLNPRWLAANEGPPRDVDQNLPLKIALRNERDAGMFAWFMRQAGVETVSAETSRPDIQICRLLNGTTAAPERFPPNRIAHFLIGRIGRQVLEALINNVDYGEYIPYAHSRLRKLGILAVASELGLNFDDASLRATHKQACEEHRLLHGAKIDLPFDPHDAVGNFTPDDWESFFFVPMNTHPAAYGNATDSPFTLTQRLGSTDWTIHYNSDLADLFAGYLRKGRSVIALSGGAHIARSLQSMHERKLVPMDGLRWHIGVKACEAYLAEKAGI